MTPDEHARAAAIRAATTTRPTPIPVHLPARVRYAPQPAPREPTGGRDVTRVAKAEFWRAWRNVRKPLLSNGESPKP